MAVPTRTPQQRRDASARAVAARQRRAQVAAQLKSGEVTLSALLALADDEPAIAAMPVRVVLESLPRMGPRRSGEAMSRLRISPSRRLRGLGSAQRRALLDVAARIRSQDATGARVRP